MSNKNHGLNQVDVNVFKMCNYITNLLELNGD